jgi:hypothetical protein
MGLELIFGFFFIQKSIITSNAAGIKIIATAIS